MKHILITFIISVVAGIAGYFTGINKSNLDNTSAVLKREIIGKNFLSETLFRINIYGSINDPHGSSVMIGSQSIEAQLATMRSRENYRKAIEDYGLEKLFGKEMDELIQYFSENIEYESMLGTDLIKLIVYADTELKAQKTAYAVTHTYANMRIEVLDNRRSLDTEAFKKKRKEQEVRVEEYRARLYALSKKLQIPYYGKNSRYYERKEKNQTDGKENRLIVSIEEKTLFGKAREDYERELTILDAIKNAEFIELIGSSLIKDPIIFHQVGWSDEVAVMMKQRK